VTYIIGEPCIDNMDRSCIEVCPVDCIIPTDRMLVIDPDDCIDCGACMPACPVDAIVPDTDVPEEWEPFVRINGAIADGVWAVNQLVSQYGSASDHVS
jgi:ferredoxin